VNIDPNSVYIVAGARTPMVEYVGSFKDVSAPELGAIASRAALARASVPPEAVDHVVCGHVLHAGGGSIYAARHMALKAGVPVAVPALTVNRLCGSGMQAAITAAHLIQSRDAETVLVGGMESMSQAPHVMHGLRAGLKLGQGGAEDYLWAALTDSHAGCTMAATAENCAAQYKITRQEQDCFAALSQQRAADAWDAGRFAEEVVPVELTVRKGVHLVDRDNHLRPDTTVESLARLAPAISQGGTVTAGNASGIVDGGAALVVSSGRIVLSKGLTPLGRIVAWATVGVEPTMMGMGPVPATRAVLDRAGLQLSEIDLFEVNEAFAGQYLAVERELGLDRARVNVNGGAIALGHPLGMTGTRQILTLLLELRRRGLSTGLATACIGGGQGIATIVEQV
jgi:acetyl-CoA acetyltransferase family protein